jgi:hypothetical protein
MRISRRLARPPDKGIPFRRVTVEEARAALNADADIAETLRRVWHLLDGGDRHAMSGGKLDRAEGVTWRDPFASFRIERHGDPYGQMQTWRVNFVSGTAKMLHERPLRVDEVPQPWDDGLLAAELAAAVRADAEDPRLIWRRGRREVKPDYGRALGVPHAKQSEAARLRDALDAQLGREWVRDAGWWMRRDDTEA